ncbi:hypothetical protein FS837_008788 [Tulasnella sp. UAMH 9824]|nr:hypothetical protein FS837_008788 [Tulasnella sp. UAMH 9824]
MDASQLIFHEDFNFHDGNLLVSASGSRDGRPSSPEETVHFRLHKSILGIYSTTFADMLSMPQGDNPVEHAVIQLQDPLDHVIKLLTTIYYGGSVPQEPLSRAKWDFLVPVLVLADKYDMGPLATNLLPKLLEDWPTTLQKWDDVDTRTRSIVRATANQQLVDPFLPSPEDTLPEPAMVVKFGQAHPAARNILPAAFYHLSRLSPSTPEDLGEYDYNRSEGLHSADYSLLTSADWVRVAQGQANITEWLYNYATAARPIDAIPCFRWELPETEGTDGEGRNISIPSPCGRVSWWYTEAKPLILEIGAKATVDVLAGLKAIRDDVENINRVLTPESELCTVCKYTVVKELDNSRRKFWGELPSFFCLGDYPNWGQS